jgi:cbb3-type cytochrome oxidase subunit 3
MVASELAYFVFGATLCALLAGIAAYTYRRSQKERVESPKYRMLEDEEER